MRLTDLINHLASDFRIQFVFTISEPRFTNSVLLEKLILQYELPYLPWEIAIKQDFDLAITATTLDEFPELHVPLLMLSHGPGHSKTISLASNSSRHKDWLSERSADSPPREIILVNEEEHELFGDTCPSIVVGDAVFDSLYNSRSRRNEFRKLLKVEKRKLVVLSSTWHDNSLFGSYPSLASDLLLKYPIDEYCFAQILHPSVWITHGAWQIRTWFRDALDAGLRLIPYESGWQATILAADCVIGDHGSVSLYANMLGIPCCFMSLPEQEMTKELTIVREALNAPRARSLDELDTFLKEPNHIDKHRLYEVQKTAFAYLGESIRILAKHVYSHLELPYNDQVCTELSLTLPDLKIIEPQSHYVCFNKHDEAYAIQRFPASLAPTEARFGFLIAEDNEPNYRILQNADGALLSSQESLSHWKDTFPLASHALLQSGSEYFLVDRAGTTKVLKANICKNPCYLLGGILLSVSINHAVCVLPPDEEPISINAPAKDD